MKIKIPGITTEVLDESYVSRPIVDFCPNPQKERSAYAEWLQNVKGLAYWQAAEEAVKAYGKFYLRSVSPPAVKNLRAKVVPHELDRAPAEHHPHDQPKTADRPPPPRSS
jgi:hypothetical protein